MGCPFSWGIENASLVHREALLKKVLYEPLYREKMAFMVFPICSNSPT